MITETIDSNYTGFAYVKDGILRDYMPIATKEWYWIYVHKGRSLNNYICGYGMIIRPAGVKVNVFRHKPESIDGVNAIYYRFADNDQELFRYDGGSFILRWRLFVRNFLNNYWYHARLV
jgi:hypothetical protein